MSDGLVADLGHVCAASGLAALIEAADVPLSEPVRASLAVRPDLLELVLTGGDDYELLFTVAPDMAPVIARLAGRLGLALTAIGRMTAGSGVTVRGPGGEPMRFAAPGYTHF